MFVRTNDTKPEIDEAVWQAWLQKNEAPVRRIRRCVCAFASYGTRWMVLVYRIGAWMYRLIVESLLGFRLDVDKLYLTPRLAPTWNSFTLHYRFRETVYQIVTLRTHDANLETSVTVDGVPKQGLYVPLLDDHKEHWVEISVPS